MRKTSYPVEGPTSNAILVVEFIAHSAVWNLVKCLGKMKQDNICLSSGTQALLFIQVIYCQLCFTEGFQPEAMRCIIEDAMGIQMYHDGAFDNVLEQLTHY